MRGILETDMLSMEERHKKTISFWEFWGEQGPAWGMIGTLIGLINMLKNLEDSSTDRSEYGGCPCYYILRFAYCQLALRPIC